MQKLWFRSKRSQPLPPEVEDTSSPSTQEASQEIVNSSKGFLKFFPKFLKKPFPLLIPSAWLFLPLGVVGVMGVGIFGLQYLLAPESTSNTNLTCKSKISGDWQTPFGKVTLQEKGGNQVSGKYKYTNFERGNIVGEFTGNLRNNVVAFEWQETPYKLPLQKGKGVLIFGESCKEFYGSYGTENSTSNFGNWQGSIIPK